MTTFNNTMTISSGFSLRRSSWFGFSTPSSVISPRVLSRLRAMSMPRIAAAATDSLTAIGTKMLARFYPEFYGHPDDWSDGAYDRYVEIVSSDRLADRLFSFLMGW